MSALRQHFEDIGRMTPGTREYNDALWLIVHFHRDELLALAQAMPNQADPAAIKEEADFLRAEAAALRAMLQQSQQDSHNAD